MCCSKSRYRLDFQSFTEYFFSTLFKVVVEGSRRSQEGEMSVRDSNRNTLISFFRALIANLPCIDRNLQSDAAQRNTFTRRSEVLSIASKTRIGALAFQSPPFSAFSVPS